MRDASRSKEPDADRGCAGQDNTSSGLNCVYGPVPSRWLGQSLGIDPVPSKTCNWNCIYCQLGRTTPLTNRRQAFYPEDDIVEQVRTVLAAHGRDEIDWLTVVGSGEPTLHSGLGRLIRGVKNITDLPVAVITNGALLYRPEVREELMPADAVLPSLDAGSERIYRTMNRPHPELTFQRFVDGLVAFRRVYTGRLWVETMLVAGVNDGESDLQDLATVLRRIGPNEVQLNLPVRPPAERWVLPVDEERLMRATVLLGEIARVIHPVGGEFDLSGCDDAVAAVASIIRRHPMRQDELFRTLDSWAPGEIDRALAVLSSSGQAQVVLRFGQRFWTAAGARFGERSRATP